MTTKNVAQVLKQMRVPTPKESHVYVLGCFDRRVTIYSQQVRALNLIHALVEAGELGEQKKLAIIGGGIAGLTAAAAALEDGCHVTVFEERDEILWLQSGCEHRWVHPRIYDWPDESWKNADACLPLLSWEADKAGKVAERILIKWWELADHYKERCDVLTMTQVTSITSNLVSFQHLKQSPQKSFRRQYDVVILAVGFGTEKESPGTTLYWHSDNLDDPPARPNCHYLISGCGDGGLTDLLRVRVKRFDVQRHVNALEHPALQELRERVSRIEHKAAMESHPEPYIGSEYDKIASDLDKDKTLVPRIFGELRPDINATLNGRDEHPYSFKASALSRLLTALIAPSYIPGGLVEDPVYKDGRYSVKFLRDNSEHIFDRVIRRHGPELALRKHQLKPIFDACLEPMTAMDTLDLTRRRIFPEHRWRGIRNATASVSSSPPAPEDLDEPPPGSPVALKPTATDDPKHRTVPAPPPRSAVTALRGETTLSFYLKRVIRQNERGMEWLPHTSINDVYVGLDLSVDDSVSATSLAETGLSGKEIRIADLLSPNRGTDTCLPNRWLIRGSAGSGKTTMLRALALQLARHQDGNLVPVYERLPRLVRMDKIIVSMIEQAVALERPQGAGDFADELDRIGRDGRLVLLLDGLDEVQAEDLDGANDLVIGYAQQWRDSTIIVTTRTTKDSRISGFHVADVLPLNRERRIELLARRFNADKTRAEQIVEELSRNKRMWELAGSPLFLTLYVIALAKGNGIGNEHAFYDTVLGCLLNGNHRPSTTPSLPMQEAGRLALRELAFALTRDGREGAPVSELEELLYGTIEIRDRLQRQPRWEMSLRTFLDDVANLTGIFGPYDGGDVWRFSHRTFREVLASEALRDRVARENGAISLVSLLELANIHDHVADERWSEPLALLAAGEKQPDLFLTDLAKARPSLGLRAAASASTLSVDTLQELLALKGSLQDRRRVITGVFDQVGDLERGIRLLDHLREKISDGNDRYFIDLALTDAGTRWPGARHLVEAARSRLFQDIPPPPPAFLETLETIDGPVSLWREMPSGSFRMGSDRDDASEEQPSHPVRIVSPFRLGAVPITRRHYAAFDPNHSSPGWLPDHPVVNVTWFEAISFCRWLSSTVPWARGARLPYESEWEYACLGGAEGLWWCGPEALEDAAWYRANAESRAHAVGRKRANKFGFYDMHGNVREWCMDLWTKDYSALVGGVTIDCAAPFETERPDGARVLRGGCFLDRPDGIRAQSRAAAHPQLKSELAGFRVLLPGPLPAAIISSPKTPMMRTESSL